MRRLYFHAESAVYIPWLLISSAVARIHERWRATR